MRRRRRVLRRAAVACGALTALGGGIAVTTPARAAVPPANSGAAVGTATAGGVRTSYDLPGFLVVDKLFDAGGPVSQAVVNSSGGGTAFASVPYPGDTVVNLPAAANVATGQPFPFTYPLYVIADGNLTPSAAAQDATGTVVLDAASHDRSAQARARAAGPTAGVIHTAGSMQSSGVEIAADGTMTSTAESLTRGIDVGVLKIAEVHVRGVSVLHPGESRPTTTSTIDVIGATVLGRPVGLTKDGITAPGSGDGPAYRPVLDALNDALRSAGVSVSLAGVEQVAGGVSAAGVQIVQRGALPFHGSPVGVARTLIGNASSFIVGNSGSLIALAGSPAAAVPAPGVGPVGPTGPGAPVLGVPPTATETGSAPGMGIGPTSAGSTAEVAPQGRAASAAGAPRVRVALASADLKSRIGLLYLFTSIGAGLALLFSLLWRVKGVR